MNANVLANAANAGRKNRPRCGSARRKLREEREATSPQPAGGVNGERREYQPGGATASTTSRAAPAASTTTTTKKMSGGRGRVHPEVSLRALHGAKDEEARIKERDEARWVEAEQLVTALKDSKDAPQPKPLPALHAKGQVDKLMFAQPPSTNSWVNEYKYR